MKQNAMRSIQPRVLRRVVVTIAVIALVPIAVLSQSNTNDAVKQQSNNSSVQLPPPVKSSLRQYSLKGPLRDRSTAQVLPL